MKKKKKKKCLFIMCASVAVIIAAVYFGACEQFDMKMRYVYREIWCR